MVKDYRIRQGKSGDMQALFSLIQELAEFEKAPHMVSNTPEQLRMDFELHKAFEFLVAEVAGIVVGISLYYPRYSTWKGRCFYLEDLYVQPTYRGKGMGEALLRATADKAKAAGANRLDWQVLDWNADAVRFYERMGAVVEQEWWNCKWSL